MSQNNRLAGTWDASQMNVIIGAMPVSGLSDGDSIVARRMNPFYNSRAGNDGTVGRAKVTDKRGTFELHILQTSDMLDEISALFNLDSLSEEGKFVGPLLCSDLSGRTVLSAGQAWLNEIGDVGFAAGEVGERIFTFECADLKMWIGGNN